jgi:hypothetical protein
MRCLVIPTGGPLRHEEIKGLADLNRLVGGYIEAVRAPRSDVVIYANEEGLLMSLPVNLRASLWTGLPLVGDVVVLGNDGSPEETDVPAGVEDGI